MKRIDFLKSLGFGGASLMAVLASCQQQQLLPPGEVASGIPGSTAPASTSTTSTTVTGPATTTAVATAPANPTTAVGTNALLTLDLTASANSALLKNGGYIAKNGIVVARTSRGVYVAATQTCSHEPRKNVVFQSDSYGCTVHGARFDLTGKGLNSLGSRGLKIYQVTLTGNILTIA